MSEAEVSLRLAFWLVRKKLVSDDDNSILVAIDGRQAKAGGTVVFDVTDFLRENHWSKTDRKSDWRGTYRCSDAASRLVILSTPGLGDLVCRLSDGRSLHVEAKGGRLTSSRSNPEYPLIREALGQLLTRAEVSKQDLLGVAVPYSPKFAKLAAQWREAPLIKRVGIHILLVGRDGEVDGLSAWSLDVFRRHQAEAAAQEILDGMVKGVLSRVTPDFPPVKPNEYPGYIAFARQAKSVVVKWDVSSTADLAMAELVSKWASRGNRRELLLRIAQDCFGWVPPEDRPGSPGPD
jgi:hypothetical protein